MRMMPLPASRSVTGFSRVQLIAFSALALPLALVVFPAYAILPGFYAQNTSIPIATIGIILIAARAFDALVDPLIGYWSDRTASRWGTRKPWLLVGTVVLVVSMPKLYVPGVDATAGSYLFWFLAFYLGYSLIEIPYKAWGTELASDYRQRSLIASALAFAFAIGTLLFAVAPFFQSEGNRAYEAETLSAIAIGFVVTLPVLCFISLWMVPIGNSRGTPSAVSILRTVQDMIRNRPLLWFVGIFVLTGLGQGVFYGLVFLYLTVVLPFKQDFALVLLVDAVVTLVSLPLWYRLMISMGKHQAWGLGMLISALALGALLVIPDKSSSLAILLFLIGLRALGSAVVYIAPNALIGDVVDYELLKSRANRAANFHAVVSLATKGTATLGGGVGLMLVGVLGFDPKIALTAETSAAFRFVATGLPALLLVGAAFAAWTFPLTRRHQRTVERALVRRGRNVEQHP